uniref:Odorant binding protein n=1 Tax=Semiothisa cinerearia TaxID=2249628 RepID=A0A889XKY5_9NEOP|nr:odorant binding protein [Semiothisa cinerearia]
MGSYDERDSNSGYGENTRGYDGMDGRMGSYDSRMGSGSHRYGNDREDSMRNHDSGYGDRDHGYNGRNDFQQSDYGSDMPNQYGYQSSTQSSRRYKREKRTENSGQRSQFNPNSKKSSFDDSYQSDEKSGKENSTSKDDDKKACALHCFLENLEMTAEDGMPDRYLVTHTLTKDVNNEDLKDFLQESIEECFQMLDNENTDEKCEFSKNLLMCLSEKGRANCDDWKDDLRF